MQATTGPYVRFRKPGNKYSVQRKSAAKIEGYDSQVFTEIGNYK